MNEPSMLDKPAVKMQTDEPKLSYDELLAQHQRLQAELDRRDDEAAQLVQTGGQPVSSVPRVDKKGPQYRFEVSPSAAHLKMKTITCGDESEAKRIYCLETPDTGKDKHGRAVNPAEYRWNIVNLDEDKRQDAIRNKYRFAELRRKHNLGVTLSNQEKQELTKLDKQFGPEARRVAAATGKCWNPSPQPVGAA